MLTRNEMNNIKDKLPASDSVILCEISEFIEYISTEDKYHTQSWIVIYIDKVIQDVDISDNYLIIDTVGRIYQSICINYWIELPYN